METTTFTAPDIECDGCANAIKNALGRVEGIESVDVDIDHKQVTVVHGIPVEEVASILDRAGFPVAGDGPVDPGFSDPISQE